MTASLIRISFSRLILPVAQSLAALGQPAQQRRDPPIVPLGSEVIEARDDYPKSDLVRHEDWAAAPGREAVARRPDDIDVARTIGDSFRKDLRSLIDHRIEQTLEDLAIGDRRPTRNAMLSCKLNGERGSGRRRKRRPTLVAVVPFAGLLTVPAGFEQGAAQSAVGGISRTFSRFDPFDDSARADVHARHVQHSARTHRHADPLRALCDAVDLTGVAP